MKIQSTITVFVIAIVGICFLFSCSQQEGIGGNSHIKGKIMVNYYNDDFSLLLSDEPVPAKDENVFLIFGNDSTVGEKVTTSFTGDFEFNYLWQGNYKLYYYTKDSTGISPDKIEKVKNITLGKNETLTINGLFINEILNWDEGTSSIKGTVYVINYRNSSTYPNLEIKDITPAQEQEIYMTYGNHPFYDVRTRTSSDGTFMFSNLIKGNYHIFLYSEDVTGGTAFDVIKKDFEITKNQQDIVMEEIIYIKKL